MLLWFTVLAKPTLEHQTASVNQDSMLTPVFNRNVSTAALGALVCALREKMYVAG